jgi:hypothetical protein
LLYSSRMRVPRPIICAAPAPRASQLAGFPITALDDPKRVVFLDVETTGLSWFYDELTFMMSFLLRRTTHSALRHLGSPPGRLSRY